MKYYNFYEGQLIYQSLTDKEAYAIITLVNSALNQVKIEELNTGKSLRVSFEAMHDMFFVEEAIATYRKLLKDN